MKAREDRTFEGHGRTANVLLALVFALLLALPLADLAFHIDRTTIDEKRTPTPFPGWPTTIDAIAAFPKLFEDYYNDHFGFRAPLVKAVNMVPIPPA